MGQKVLLASRKQLHVHEWEGEGQGEEERDRENWWIYEGKTAEGSPTYERLRKFYRTVKATDTNLQED